MQTTGMVTLASATVSHLWHSLFASTKPNHDTDYILQCLGGAADVQQQGRSRYAPLFLGPWLKLFRLDPEPWQQRMDHTEQEINVAGFQTYLQQQAITPEPTYQPKVFKP